MPSEVALTSRAWSGSASLRLSQGRTRRLGRSCASASACSGGAVGDGDGDAVAQQGRGDRSRRAAGAEDQRRAGGRIDAVGAQVGQEAPAVGVAAGDSALAEHQRVDRAGASRAGVHAVAQREGGALVRDGDVGAGEPGIHQAADGGGEVVRADRQGDVGAVDRVALQPEAVQAR